MANVMAARAFRGCAPRRLLPSMVLWIALAIAVLIAPAMADPVLPELTGRVVDSANLLTAADRAALETELAAIEEKSTDQVVVVTVPSLQGYPIEEFGYRLGRKWGIGQKGKDNGVLLIVAPNERKLRIEVGRRLEPLLPDGRTGSIISRDIVPTFRRGDFAGGIKAGVSQIKAALYGDKSELEERAKRPPPPVDYSGYIEFAIWLLIVLFVIRQQMLAAREMANLTPEQRRARQRSGGVVILPGGWGSGSGGWSGGLGGGGGGGGFSGGGGDFGGGGASGDW